MKKENPIILFFIITFMLLGELNLLANCDKKTSQTFLSELTSPLVVEVIDEVDNDRIYTFDTSPTTSEIICKELFIENENLLYTSYNNQIYKPPKFF
jgi:hypothetical protein